VALVAAVARRCCIALVVGYIEEGGKPAGGGGVTSRGAGLAAVYNSVVLVDAEGRPLIHRRKRRLIEEERGAGVTAGDVDVCAECGGRDWSSLLCTPPLPWLGGARLALLICADIEVCDAADDAVHAGATALIVIACAYVEARQPPVWLGAATHAIRHQVSVCYCNYATTLSADGRVFGGSSRVIGPDGRDIACMTPHAQHGLLLASLATGMEQRLVWSGAALAEATDLLLQEPEWNDPTEQRHEIDINVAY